MSFENKNYGILSYGSFRAGVAWIILILGILGYIAAYFVIPKDMIWREIVIKISDILVIGVIIGYLSNAANFLGIFKKDLEAIIYSKKFLCKQTDLHKIWESVTEAMFKSKFKPISKDLFDLIKKTYLSEDAVSYYDNYKVITDVDWADEDKKFVIIRDTIEFDLIAENEKEISLPFRTGINVKGLNKDEYYSNFHCKIDNKDVEVSVYEELRDNGDTFSQECRVSFSGSTKYDVNQVREKKYCFEQDYDISFKANYIVKGANITINHPKDMKVTFIARGTGEDFKNVKTTDTTKIYTYKGLILPKQGYIFALNKR